MNTTSLPETINLHFHRACEMRCQHCFATFLDCTKLSLEALKRLIDLISIAPKEPGQTKPRRLNFVGGEPTLHPHFLALVKYAHAQGLRVSIVTNGNSLIRNGFPKELEILELVGVSIDSLDPSKNKSIGRAVRNETISEAQWHKLFAEIATLGVGLKINTTITRHNLHEDFTEFIKKADPKRWKVFQAMVVKGQNCQNSAAWKVSRQEYDTFVERHLQAGVQIHAEPEDLMRGSYAMISPDGRFYDSVSGSHHYSDPILSVGVLSAWGQIQYDDSLFETRTQNY